MLNIEKLFKTKKLFHKTLNYLLFKLIIIFN